MIRGYKRRKSGTAGVVQESVRGVHFILGYWITSDDYVGRNDITMPESGGKGLIFAHE